MNNSQTIDRSFGAITWGAIFIWWGVTEMIKLPNGAGILGIGLILLGVNALRLMNRVSVQGFWLTIGILAVVWGGLELAGSVLRLPYELPIFAVLLIVMGLSMLVPELMRPRNA